MALKNRSLRLCLAMLVVALMLLSHSNATAAPRLFKHSNPAATQKGQNPMVYYPQGCRCCWFNYKPTITCGAMCCGLPCTCT